MKEIKTEIIISATPEKVWAVLTNFSYYSYWNPFITSITGDLKVGSRIIVKIEASEKKLMTFKPIIASALHFLANSSAIIIDLRENTGGEPDMGSQMESYFFKEKTLTRPE